VTVLTDAETRSTTLVADSNAPANACLFARAVLADWELSHLAADACACLTELVVWLLANEPSTLIEITLVWDGPLAFTEVSDHGRRLPNRAVWRSVDGGRAVGTLEAFSLEWDAEGKPRGRCLWASYHTGRDEQ